MQLVIRPADDQLKRWENQIAALGQGKARVAMARGINRTTTSTAGKVIRAASKQSGIPLAAVKKAVKTKLAAHYGNSPLEGIVYASGAQLPLKLFKARQFKQGVKATIWGERRLFKSAFIFAGTYTSGNEVGNGHVFRRVSNKSLPIELVYGPSVPEAIIAGEAANAFKENAERMLPERITHELGRLLGQ